jgi:hypothetical protein
MKTQNNDTTAVPKAALLLGYAGLFPFLAGAVMLWLVGPDQEGWWLRMLTGYAVVILAFMGAVHWGLAMAGSGAHAAGQYSFSVLPALLG